MICRSISHVCMLFLLNARSWTVVSRHAGFDCFSTVAWTNDTTINTQAQFNRLMLLQAMTEVGNFINYDEEW